MGGMIAKKLLIASWATSFVYCVGLFFMGDFSLSATSALQLERDRLQTNLETLKSLNDSLQGDLHAVSVDGDSIAVYARELGYAPSDVNVVRVSGLPPTVRRNYAAGSISLAQVPKGVSEMSIRFIALLTGCVVFILSLVSPRKRRESRS